MEGTLIGPWIAELGTGWRNASQDLGGCKLVIDLTNVTVISHEGGDAIFDLMKKRANFSCGSVLMKHVRKGLARKKPKESHSGEHVGDKAQHESCAIREPR